MAQAAISVSHFGIHVTDLVRMEEFDIEAPVEAILPQTEAICRNRPGFASRAEWRAAVAERMASV